MRDEAMLRKVGDTIAAEPERYDQHSWGFEDDCGSTACIAGHAIILHPAFRGWDQVHVAWAAAEAALGLTPDEGDALFAANWKPAGDPSVPLHERVQAALYGLADGKSIEEVSA